MEKNMSEVRASDKKEMETKIAGIQKKVGKLEKKIGDLRASLNKPAPESEDDGSDSSSSELGLDHPVGTRMV